MNHMVTWAFSDFSWCRRGDSNHNPTRWIGRDVQCGSLSNWGSGLGGSRDSKASDGAPPVILDIILPFPVVL